MANMHASVNELHELVGELGKLKTKMYNGDFLCTWDKSDDELRAVLTTAEILEAA